VLITHLGEVLKSHAADIISLQDVQIMLDHVRQHSPAIVEELTPKLMTLTEIHRVLANLLRERVPIRDLPRILTALASRSATKDPEELTELVRQSLSRAITSQHADESRTLWVCVLDPALEADLVDRARTGAVGADAEWVERLTRALKRQLEKLVAMGHTPVVLCSPRARPLARALLERAAPTTAVLSHAEIAPEAKLKSVGLVTIDPLTDAGDQAPQVPSKPEVPDKPERSGGVTT
jgi:flagellar biosynthesis protein FlhA